MVEPLIPAFADFCLLEDINRILKPGCSALHCFDACLRPSGQSYVNGLIPYLYANAPVYRCELGLYVCTFVPLYPWLKSKRISDTYAMSQKAYEAKRGVHHQTVVRRLCETNNQTGIKSSNLSRHQLFLLANHRWIAKIGENNLLNRYRLCCALSIL